MTPRSRATVTGRIKEPQTLSSPVSTWGHRLLVAHQRSSVFSELRQSLLDSSIASLAADLDSWMSSNRLSLNPSKTQLIWLGTRQQLLKLDFALLAAQFPQFTFLTSVRD